MHWEKIDIEFPIPRMWPVCFKLKDNLYICGGHGPEDASDVNGVTSFGLTYFTCCDSYNLHEGKYHQSVHLLPYPIFNVNNIVTDADESFAIMIDNTKKNVSIYRKRWI